MLKMALFDCAINEKCCSVDGGRGICPLFSSPPPGDLTAQEPPSPGIYHPRQKKNVNARGSALGEREPHTVLSHCFKCLAQPRKHNTKLSLNYLFTYVQARG